MCLRFTGKMIAKNTKLSPSNGLEPATHEKVQMPISNRLRPKEFFERDHCATGWSYIYDHSTNPVNGIDKLWTFEGEGSKWPKRHEHTYLNIADT